MYKRINKHIKKKEREEALGLDEETKEILGLHETDSDESDSSDEEQSDVGSSTPGSDEESEEGRAPSARGSVELRRKWEEGGTDGGSSSQAGEEDSEGENEGSEGEDEEEDNDPPPMTVSEALNQPLYSVRKGSDARACIMCPGKELKHAKMASIHVASSVSQLKGRYICTKTEQTHLRRMKRFATLAARVSDENEDPRLLVAALDKSVRIVPKENTIGVCVPSANSSAAPNYLLGIDRAQGV
jgi:hypothetical protein